MARYYTEISKEEFLKKVQKIMKSESDDEDDDDEGYPYNLPKKIQDDLKVEFDWENFYAFDDEPRPHILEGYREVAPGFHVFFAWAGGDWEYPVTFIFYNSDKGIRAYVPSDGNIWNKEEKCAFGGDEVDENTKLYPEKIYNDIIKRIKLKK